jgi:hypothetical protein
LGVGEAHIVVDAAADVLGLSIHSGLSPLPPKFLVVANDRDLRMIFDFSDRVVVRIVEKKKDVLKARGQVVMQE